jgi:Amt family ammonium transporter
MSFITMLFLAAADPRLSALEAATKAAQLAGDNAWMLTSAALVLMMTGPVWPFSMAAWCAAKTF